MKFPGPFDLRDANERGLCRNLGDVDGWFGKGYEVRPTIEAGQQLDPRTGKMSALTLGQRAAETKDDMAMRGITMASRERRMKGGGCKRRQFFGTAPPTDRTGLERGDQYQQHDRYRPNPSNDGVARCGSVGMPTRHKH